MKIVLAASVALLIAVSPGCAAEPSAQHGQAQLAQEVDNLLAEWNVPNSPGCALVLVDRGNVILERCYGLASIEHGIPIKPTTRFELASVSKPFTAFGVLLLEQEGKLAISDNVQAYLPELPDYGSPITIADLLHHTSGISD